MYIQFSYMCNVWIAFNLGKYNVLFDYAKYDIHFNSKTNSSYLIAWDWEEEKEKDTDVNKVRTNVPGHNTSQVSLAATTFA